MLPITVKRVSDFIELPLMFQVTLAKTSCKDEYSVEDFDAGMSLVMETLMQG